MKKYELLSHTADVRIKVSADTPKELFEISAEALCQIMLPDFQESELKESNKEYSFEIESVDLSALLIEFLAEQLSLMQTYNVLLSKVIIEHIDSNNVSCSFSGYKVDFFEEDTKAVTYHEAEIVKNNEGQLETIIVLDL